MKFQWNNEAKPIKLSECCTIKNIFNLEVYLFKILSMLKSYFNMENKVGLDDFYERSMNFYRSLPD